MGSWAKRSNEMSYKRLDKKNLSVLLYEFRSAPHYLWQNEENYFEKSDKENSKQMA